MQIIILDHEQNNFLFVVTLFSLFIHLSDIFSITCNKIYISFYLQTQISSKSRGRKQKRLVKFLSYPRPIRDRRFVKNLHQRGRMNRKGEHRTPVPTNLHPASGKLDGELRSKPRSKGRRDLPKGKATPNPRPGRPPSSSCFPAICKVACAHRRPSYRHRTPSGKISKCFLAR